MIYAYCYVHISCRETCSIWTCYSTCTYMYDSYYEQVFDQLCSHQGLLFIYQKHHSNYEVTFYIILRLHFINISLQSYIWISKIMFDWNLRKLIGILTYKLYDITCLLGKVPIIYTTRRQYYKYIYLFTES